MSLSCRVRGVLGFWGLASSSSHTHRALFRSYTVNPSNSVLVITGLYDISFPVLDDARKVRFVPFSCLEVRSPIRGINDLES